MDMENKIPPPMRVEMPEPPQPSDGEITESEAIAACRSLGLKTLRVRRLSKHAVIGKFMAQLGATQIGTGKLLLADQQIEKGIKLCDRFLQDYPHEPDVIASLMKVRLGLIDAMIKSANTLIRLNKDSGLIDLETKPMQQAFPAHQPVQQNVQIVVGGGNRETTENTSA